MTEENKDSLIKDLKSERERLKEQYEKLVLAHNDLNVKYEILAKEYHETEKTFGDLLEILNEKESSVKWIMNAGKGEQNE